MSLTTKARSWFPRWKVTLVVVGALVGGGLRLPTAGLDGAAVEVVRVTLALLLYVTVATAVYRGGKHAVGAVRARVGSADGSAAD